MLRAITQSPIETIKQRIRGRGFVRLGMVGDSLTVAGMGTGGTYTWMQHGIRSLPLWAAVLGGGKIGLGIIEGNGGYRSDQILGALGHTLDATVQDAVLVLAGTNDTGQSVPVATTMGYLNRIYDAYLNIGVLPVACTIPPRNNASAAINALIVNLNRAIIANAQSRGLPVADLFRQVTNPIGSTACAVWKTGYYYDDVHWAAAGVKAAALAVVGVVNELLGYSANGGVAPVNQYPASSDIVPNGTMLTYNGSNLPTGWGDYNGGATLSILAGGTDTDGVGLAGSNVWKLVTSAAGFCSKSGVLAAGLIPGHKYAFMARVKMDPASTVSTANAMDFEIRSGDLSKIYAGVHGAAGNVADEPLVAVPAFSYYQEFVYPLTEPSGANNAYLRVGTVNQNTTIQLANVGLTDLTAMGY